MMPADVDRLRQRTLSRFTGILAILSGKRSNISAGVRSLRPEKYVISRSISYLIIQLASLAAGEDEVVGLHGCEVFLQ